MRWKVAIGRRSPDWKPPLYGHMTSLRNTERERARERAGRYGRDTGVITVMQTDEREREGTEREERLVCCSWYGDESTQPGR